MAEPTLPVKAAILAVIVIAKRVDENPQPQAMLASELREAEDLSVLWQRHGCNIPTKSLGFIKASVGDLE